MTFAEARAAFPVLERYAYLNAGSVGPLARRTYEALIAAEKDEVEEGRAGWPYLNRMLEAREELRTALAAQIVVPPENMSLTTSTTEGCRIVMAGLEVGRDDEIVTTDAEHFGLLGAIHVSGARIRVAPVRDRPAAEAVEAILAEVGPRTRLIALSHVLWLDGHVIDLEALRAAVDVPLLVDGAQSVGAIPVDASPYDFYTVSGQKWLCGPAPTGGLYVKEPERLAVALPSYFSQAGYEPDGRFEPREGCAAVRSGLDPRAVPGGADRGARGASGLALRAVARDGRAVPRAAAGARLRRRDRGGPLQPRLLALGGRHGRGREAARRRGRPHP